jgi:hypothetical protein
MDLPSTMKATVLVAPHRFELLDRAVPRPGDEDVLIRVRACGICGTDLKIIHTGMPHMPPYGEFKENGVDLAMSLWRGIAAPKGTPAEALARLERAFVGAAQSGEFRDFAARMGATVEILGARDFDRFMASDDREIAALMEQIGLKKQ